ncbi:DUF928 domain-containing protein [Nostoc sp. CHAB 5844]|nr:DUF928 domain-containing protein [Nostoc sp. CHAB 5844]
MQQKLGVSIILCSILFLPVNATIALPVEQNLPISQILPKAPIRFQDSGNGKRMRRIAGGIREHCLLRAKRLLTVLTPEKNPVLTTSEHPQLFAYIPETANTSVQGFELVLQDADEQVIYQEQLQFNQKPGVFSINLTGNSQKPLLEVGQEYYWYLTVICDRSDRSLDIVTTGKVQRIIPDKNLINKLKNASPRECAALYAASGIWYDSQAILADLLRQRPNDPALKADWQSLLESVRLGEIAQEPLEGELQQVTGDRLPP